MNMHLFDAQAALGFVQSQTAHIERTVNEAPMKDIIYPSLIPVDTSANPFTDTVTYYSADKFGKADWINGNADDIPLAGTERSSSKTTVYTAGIGYGYGWEEVQRAMQLGVNLQADDAAAARRAYEEMVNAVALKGDAGKGFSGLFSYPGVTVSAAATGNWAAATPAQIIADFNSALTAVSTATNDTVFADTVLLPVSRLQYLATTAMPNTVVTVLEFLRANNVYTAVTGQPLTIRGLSDLEAAGAGGVKRMVAYRRSPDVLKLHIPMPHRFLPAWQAGPLRWEVPGVFRLGGLDVRRKKEMAYVDGI